MSASGLRIGLHLPMLVAGLSFTAASAHGATWTTLDLTAGLGVSSNPSLQLGGQGSAFGRLSALGMHEWRSERTTTSLSAYGENTTYLKGYGSKQIFDLRASTVHSVSPTVSIFGNIGFQGDFAGQLSNRFATPTPEIGLPPPDPSLPVIVEDPGLIGFGGRQYRISGQAGVSLRASERSSVSLSAGGQRNFATGSLKESNYNSYFGTASYDHQLNERTSLGVAGTVQYQDYDNGSSSTVFNPRLTARRQFSAGLEGTASVGVLLSTQKGILGGSSRSVDPSFSLSLCKTGERDRICGQLSRDARNSLGVGVGQGANSFVVNTTAAVNYARQIDSDQTLQLAVSAVRYSSTLDEGDDLRTTYLTLTAGYDRKIRQRVAVGVSGGARKLFQAGTDPKADFNATAYLRYRFGDIK